MNSKIKIIVILLFLSTSLFAQTDWRKEFQSSLPILGHRNWILIADAAYPLQIKPGITTIYTGEDQIDLVKEVLKAVNDAPHVSPDIFLDKEIDFVPETEVSGIESYKKQLDRLLKNEKVTKVLHEELLEMIDEAGQDFKVLVLKTDLTIPYTSVFIRLDCGYWNTEQEQQMRELMK